MHYQRVLKHGDPGQLTNMRSPRIGQCSVDGCGRKIQSRGLCLMHYERFSNTGCVGGPGTKIGKGTIHHSGYRYIQFGGKSFGEYRLVMEVLLGRKLRKGENVHHIDGDTLNNEPDNLELWVKRQPPGQRVSDRVAIAIKILQDYPEWVSRNGFRLVPLESQEASDLMCIAEFGGDMAGSSGDIHKGV